MESRKSVKNLSETIHSLLGSKAKLTSAWVQSVCNIVKNLSLEETKDSHGNKDGEPAISIKVHKTREELSALTATAKNLSIERRQALNDFLDLKGNIRVFCRIRPIRIGEHLGRLRPVVASDSRNVNLKVAEGKSKIYSFDRVFHPASSQDMVFSEIEPVIKSAIDGYNACILAYGQTGTGKTFTMEGTTDSPGIVPRAIELLFKQAAESNHVLLVSFSMLEIYLGNVRDLLLPHPTKPTDPRPPCLSIHMDPKGGTEIENLVAIKVSDFHQALKLYRLGCRYRSTASTNSNAVSSRSHCMIRLSITCFNASERPREINKIWLVDLGGSERILKTKASGKRLDEGKAINLSLLALGDVINALQRKKRHIPYRNSKLTQVLKDSLGQDSKTLMLVHISPKEEDVCETICSLNFASRARSIHLGHDEPTEEQERKEAKMFDLQSTIEKIEGEHQRVLRDIKKLKLTLEKLTDIAPSSEGPMEASYLSADESSNNQENTKNKHGDPRAASPFGLPSFMKPTVSSRRKSGMRDQTSALVFATKRRPPSHRAESVNFPLKKNPEYNPDRSISKSTYNMALAAKSNTDDVTEYSQDISECEIKVVVSEDKGHTKRSLNEQRAYHLKRPEKYRNTETNDGKSTRFSRVDNWLHLQKNEPSNGIFTQRKKRIIANKLLPEDEVSATTFVAENTYRPKVIDEESGVKEMEKLKTEQAVNKPMVMLKDLFSVETKSNSSRVSYPDEDIVEHLHESVDDGSLMDESDSFSLYPPVAGYDTVSQFTEDNEERILQAEFSDNFMLDKTISQNYLQVADYIADSEKDSSASLSTREHQSCGEENPTGEWIKDNKQGTVNATFQLSTRERLPGLHNPDCQRALFLNNPLQEDLKLPYSRPQRNPNNKGTLCILKEKLQIICFSGLLGLGYLEVGYGHDFFHGIMN